LEGYSVICILACTLFPQRLWHVCCFPATEMETPEFLSVRELAALVVSMRKISVFDRKLVIRLLHSVMVKYPDCLGLWCVFEPDAFDGGDAEFVGRKGHDAAGRFAPRWDRNTGVLRFGCSCGHDSPSLGEWYFLAREARQEVVFGPYDEKCLTGLCVLCLSRVAPILERDRFIGAVGMDISLDALFDRATGEKSPSDHMVEAMLERWHFFLRDNGEIECASRHARRLMGRYVGVSRHGRLPGALQERLSGSDFAPGVLVFPGHHGELHITALRHPHTGRQILSLEEKVPRRRIAPGGTQVSAREQEVLEWLEEGKSNGEIALILGISEHTVRHHLESIFNKLGVENRRAAMLCVQQARRSPTQRLLSRVPDFALSLA
jgi:DNA-binding CsgD family transcriptional regulator